MSATVPIDKTQSMVDMLDWFEEQPCTCATVGHIAHATDWSRETVRNNLKQLLAGNYAERRYKPTGEYRLIEDPRD
jgi:DNA-binding IclR family transcriptional regulator